VLPPGSNSVYQKK